MSTNRQEAGGRRQEAKDSGQVKVGRRQQIKSYKDLMVWQKGMEIITAAYDLTRQFPIEEQYVFSTQIRRSAVSIPSNIAEGYSRHKTGEYKRFLRISHGSLYELETQVLAAVNVGLISFDQARPLIDLINAESAMLSSLINKIEAYRS